jgi:3',5'-cyclic AMP phosphodiesterase CpdA
MSKNRKQILIIIFSVFLLFATAVFAKPFNFFEGLDDNTLNIVQFTDVHIDTKTKSDNQRMLDYSSDLLKDAVNKVNDISSVDVVIFSGDVSNKPVESEFLKFVDMADRLNTKWIYAPGNHDVGIFGGLSKKRINQLLSNKLPYFSKDVLYYSYKPNNKFLILMLDGVIDNMLTSNGSFPEKELNWMEEQIKNNPDKKILLVQHFPVVEPTESNSHKVFNANKYLQIIDKYSNVIAVLSGHYHVSKITQRKNVLHISTSSLIEYPNAFRTIKITAQADSTKFEIKTHDTNLKSVRAMSKSLSKSASLKEGAAQDKNTVITIKNI